ncbi:hypothetical protein [Nitrososphaera sp.]|uniref:hypothetical protein n=1 Tax=Nitrososphaera sp. TaxID=1971748 RepID=UPI0017AB5AA0|nr:hypothetical protein [Nitrososphaera sp.]NWG38079.1 hypothetical protein [Nitrososphaera sp.]
MKWRTRAAREVYDTWVLLKAGIKPWEINGGFVYHVDLFYIRECLRLESARQGVGSDWKKVG